MNDFEKRLGYYLTRKSVKTKSVIPTHYLKCRTNVGDGICRVIFQEGRIVGQSEKGELIFKPTKPLRVCAGGWQNYPKYIKDHSRLIPIYEDSKNQK